MRDLFKRFLSAVFFAGLIMFAMGIYYCIIKAGIPYQDPTPEMTLQYAIYMGVGDVLWKTGGFFCWQDWLLGF